LERDWRQALGKLTVLAGGACPAPDERREALLHRRSRLEAGPLQRPARLRAQELEQAAHATAARQRRFIGRRDVELEGAAPGARGERGSAMVLSGGGRAAGTRR